MSAVVEARGVRKEYGGLVAVEDLTFAVERGQILGVLGPNGAGKTSAIRVLTTIFAPTRGTFAVAGIPNTRPADIRQRIGVLPESAGYPERLTGEEYLRYHARLFGLGSRARAPLPSHCSRKPVCSRAPAPQSALTVEECGSGSASRGPSSMSRRCCF